MREALSRGFATREAYADARRRELLSALSLAGIGAERTSVFGIPDQDASRDLAGLARRVGELLAWLRPRFVLAPAYEGGHPDHDAVAFAVWAACSVLRRAGVPAPVAVEFPLYHAGAAGEMERGRFLPDGPPALVIRLDEAQQRLKRCMLECFPTQQDVLSEFAVDVERFRCAPDRDFRQAPHAGPAYYDRFAWGIDGVCWRARACEALGELELLPLPAAIPA
jgi:LmbE family N-acetylglucosaminyl deacetylase